MMNEWGMLQVVIYSLLYRSADRLADEVETITERIELV